MRNLKVTDGDLIVFGVPLDYDDPDGLELIITRLRSWIAGKGLKNTEILVIPSSKIEITVMSVNDVFEDEVLKGGNNG